MWSVSGIMRYYIQSLAQSLISEFDGEFDGLLVDVMQLNG